MQILPRALKIPVQRIEISLPENIILIVQFCLMSKMYTVHLSLETIGNWKTCGCIICMPKYERSQRKYFPQQWITFHNSKDKNCTMNMKILSDLFLFKSLILNQLCTFLSSPCDLMKSLLTTVQYWSLKIDFQRSICIVQMERYH